MSQASSFPESVAGKFFFVTGLSEGSAIFVGKALHEPVDEHLTLEGKVVDATPDGHVLTQPFNTQVRFFLLDATFTLHQISDPHAHEEVVHFHGGSSTHVSAASFPYLYRWFQSSSRPHFEVHFDHEDPGRPVSIGGFGHSHHPDGTNPFHGFYDSFVSTAEQFRRALFSTPGVSSSRELDKVAELEGDLTVEIGKITNQAAVKFNQTVSREIDLQHHFEAFHGGEIPVHGTHHSMSGFSYLIERMNFAKSFARRTGKSAVVREINTFVKDAFFGLNEVVLDHCNSLDTLITETFSQYGIAYEIYPEFSSFHHFGGPAPLNVHHHEQARKPSSHPSPVGAS